MMSGMNNFAIRSSNYRLASLYGLSMESFLRFSTNSQLKPMSRFSPPAILLTAAFALWSAGPLQASGLAATVNGRPITTMEIDRLISRQLKIIDTQVPPAERAAIKSKLRNEALDTLIEVEIILSEYYKLSEGKGVKKEYVDEEVRQDIVTQHEGSESKFLKALREEGISLKQYREQKEKMLIVNMMRQSKAKDSGFASPDRKAEYLKTNAAQFREKDKIKLRTITIPKVSNDPLSTPEGQKQLISEIRARVTSGGDFAAEAKTYSQDSHSSEGGDWGWIEESAMSRQMSEVAFKLNSKAVSSVVADQDNFYLFYIEDKQLGKSRPKAEIDEEVEKLVLVEQRKKAYEDWVARLKSKANIRRIYKG
jgi:peptidyl-prolyl cis-trans isomerase SurA